MKNFEYVRPGTLEEAIHILGSYEGKARVLAGGTDLLVKMKQKEITPDALVDLKGIPGLNAIEYHPHQGMRLGALVSIREIETSPLVREHLPALAEAAQSLGSVQVRHRATLAGNLCNALPSADMAPCLIAMGALLKLVGPQGERCLPVEDLMAGSGKNSLLPGEIVTAVEVPRWPPRTGGAYLKHSILSSVDLAIVSLAGVAVLVPGAKIFQEGKIVMGAVGPKPLRSPSVEEFLRGRPADDTVLSEAGELAARDARPRTSPEYKKEMIKVLTVRAMHQAVERASRHGR